MRVLNLRQGRDIEDTKEALNLLVLFCRDNDEFNHYERSLLEMEHKVGTATGVSVSLKPQGTTDRYQRVYGKED